MNNHVLMQSWSRPWPSFGIRVGLCFDEDNAYMFTEATEAMDIMNALLGECAWLGAYDVSTLTIHTIVVEVAGGFVNFTLWSRANADKCAMEALYERASEFIQP